MALTPPILSAADPTDASEGSIDPFATQAGYERLAERIYPYVTVRMARPRFITAISAAALVCERLQDELASDGMTPPYLVFEWYVAEAFVRGKSNFPEEEWRRFPGSNKVERALRDGRAVCGESYLKTPKVFGYTGVHKRLAVGLEIVTDDVGLDEGGFSLLRTWEREQGLDGFTDEHDGPGAGFRKDLNRAVERGLEAARVRRSNSKAVSERIVRHLRFDAPGPKETSWLLQRMLGTEYRSTSQDPVATHMRRELIQRIINGSRMIETEQEQEFFHSIAESCSDELRERLEVIDTYESLCRPLEDTLHLSLFLSTMHGPAPIGVAEFLEHPLGDGLFTKLRRGLARVMESPTLLEWEPELQGVLDRYRGVDSPAGLFDAVIRHHEDAQRGKPPDGKAPWVVRSNGDRVEARAQYRTEEAPEGSNGYVHSYRTNTVARFLADLGQIAA